MKIEIANPKSIVVTAEVKQTFDTLTINRMVDFPSQKKVVVFVKELSEPLVLWEGDAYDAIGQWTDQNVSDKITELYSK